MTPRIAPNGPILDADDYRRRFPDGASAPIPARPISKLGKDRRGGGQGVIAEFKRLRSELPGGRVRAFPVGAVQRLRPQSPRIP